MSDLTLVRPHVRYQASFIDAVREFEQYDKRRPMWNYENLEQNFDEYVALRLAYEDDPPAGYVPQTDYWLIRDDEIFAGQISLRHHLNANLRYYGGHIGYEIRPLQRRKGYGTRQLALVLPKAWRLGLTRVLLTCDDDNIGSIRIIEANGGKLHDTVALKNRKRPVRRYWIEKPS